VVPTLWANELLVHKILEVYLKKKVLFLYADKNKLKEALCYIMKIHTISYILAKFDSIPFIIAISNNIIKKYTPSELHFAGGPGPFANTF